MYCNSCGMNSLDAEVCEWCKNPIGAKAKTAAAPAPQPIAAQPVAAPSTPAPLDLTQPIPPGLEVTQHVSHGGNVRMSLTGEVMEVEAPVHRAPPGTFTPPGQTYAPPPPIVPGRAVVRDLPPGAIHPRMMENAARYEDATLGEKWEKCLAMLLPILLLGVVGVHFVPTAYFWIELGTLFLAALVMGASGAIGSYDDEFAECTGVLIISYFFGPMVGLGGYLVLGLIRQEMSAMNALLLVHIAARFMFIVSAGNQQGIPLYRPEADWAMLLPHFNLLGFVSFFIICATFAGWIMSSFFRPVNE